MFSDRYLIGLEYILWTFYFRLMNNRLLLYFNHMKQELPRMCHSHDIRHPTLHLLKLTHEFPEQQIQY